MTSIIKLTGFEAEAEVLGHSRRVQFSESHLTISGLALAEAHDVLKVLATGKLQRVEGDPLAFGVDDAPPPGQAAASSSSQVSQPKPAPAPRPEPKKDTPLDKAADKAIASDRDPEPAAEEKPKRRRRSRAKAKDTAAPPEPAPFKTRTRQAGKATTGSALDPHPAVAPGSAQVDEEDEEAPTPAPEPETAAQDEPGLGKPASGSNGSNGKVGGTEFPALEAGADPWGLAPEGAVHEDLLSAPSLKHVLNTMVDLGLKDPEKLMSACEHFQPQIPALSRIPNLKERVERRLLKLDLG
jgi:hypothetical protein